MWNDARSPNFFVLLATTDEGCVYYGLICLDVRMIKTGSQDQRDSGAVFDLG
jgi:hypothetical protein